MVESLQSLRRTPGSLRHDAENDVTLVFSDVCGFTELTERLGDRAAHQVIQRHQRLVSEVVGRHAGQQIEKRGDGFLLAFASPVDAVRCAVELQHRLANERTRRDDSVEIRIGMHTGPALRDGDGYFGRSVILSARISDHARAGEILVSGRVRELLGDDAEFRLERRPELALKGFRERHPVFSVLWTSMLTLERPAAH